MGGRVEGGRGVGMEWGVVGGWKWEWRDVGEGEGVGGGGGVEGVEDGGR